jgi:hypothetical protein
VFPLGLIGTGSAAAQLWLSIPGHCQERWAKVGSHPSSDQCAGVYAFSIVRVVHAGLMAIAGGVLLGIGLVRRKRYAAWKRGAAASLRPSGRPRLRTQSWVDRTGAGLGFTLEF